MSNNIRESHETARGCGYRKKGAIYMMGGTLNAPCGKLPRICDRCPACDHGIKPSRGWTWIDPGHWFPRDCDGDLGYRPCSQAYGDDAGAADVAGTCARCPLGGAMPEKAGTLWIGEKYYPTKADFAREAQTRGISRRIAQIPKELEVGKTLVLLAHRKGIEIDCPDCEGGKVVPVVSLESSDYEPPQDKCGGSGRVEAPAIFAAFTPTGLEYIVNDNETPEELEAIEKRGCELVRVIEVHDDNGQESIEFES